jgi:DinB superfamily
MALARPVETEYAPFYAGYVARVSEDDILSVLAAQRGEIDALARALPASKASYRYADGKWSVRQVLGHIVDGERVFGHRAFCFSRGERAALPGFDENDYVAAFDADSLPPAELAAEFVAVRDANLAFLRRLREPDWARVGTASGKPVSVRALAWIMAGHPRHHLAVLRERYGVA